MDENETDDASGGRDRSSPAAAGATGEESNFTSSVRQLIEGDDPYLTKLTVGPRYYCPRGDNWARDGMRMRKNTHIKELEFVGLTGHDESKFGARHTGFREFLFSSLEGSVHKITFRECGLFGMRMSWLYTPLFYLFGKHHRAGVDYLEIADCTIEPQGETLLDFLRFLTAPLGELNSAQVFKIAQDASDGNVDEALGKYTASLAGLSSLKRTIVWKSNFSRAGGAALVFILNNTDDLVVLDVSNNCMDEEGAAILCFAVTGPSKKSKLLDCQDSIIQTLEWQAISSILQRPYFGMEKPSPRKDNDSKKNVRVTKSVTSRCKSLTLGQEEEYFNYVGSSEYYLENLDLSSRNFDDDTATLLFNSLANNSSLKTVDLSGSLRQVGNKAWTALSNCLRSPKSVLETLNLCYSSINNDALNSFAGALADNKTLTALLMYNDPGWNNRWGAFSRLLCGKSTITETFNSNHTLSKVIKNDNQPKAIKSLLEMNQQTNKFDVARQKIINNHFTGDMDRDMQYFFDMGVGVLPHVVAWVAGGGISYFYQFVRNMPFFFDFVGSGVKEVKAESSKSPKRKETETVEDNNRAGFGDFTQQKTGSIEDNNGGICKHGSNEGRANKSSKGYKYVRDRLWDNVSCCEELTLDSADTPIWQNLIDYLQSPTCVLAVLDLSGGALNNHKATLLFNSLANNSSLKIVNLSGCCHEVNNATWMALSDCLRCPSSQLKSLNLCYSSINHDALILFTEALSNNKKLKELLMYTDPEWNNRWEAFSRLLCDTSSIVDTFNSNHTLEQVVKGTNQPEAIKCLLEMNQGTDKFDVARQKIINIHFSGDVKIDMQHFIDMDVGVLSHVAAWMAGAGISFFYRFVRNMPLLFDFVDSEVKEVKAESCRNLKRQKTETIEDNN